MSDEPDGRAPTVVHITHHKSGSQWIHRILHACVPADAIVAPQADCGQFLHRPIEPGKVYPTVYITRQEFESVVLPDPWRAFVVIRDLRDTLASAYFSIKFSHAETDSGVSDLRRALLNRSVEDGLLHLMDEWLGYLANVQRSWVGTALPLVRYEDLLTADVDILDRILIDHCRLAVSRAQLREIVLEHRFERRTGGRPRGQEDVMSHERLGIAGGWVRCFTPRVAWTFQERFGDVLESTGYVSEDGWPELTRLAV